MDACFFYGPTDAQTVTFTARWTYGAKDLDRLGEAALEKTDYNQTTLGRATGIHQSNVSRFIKGDVDATIRGLLALEDLTGKPFRELFAECEGRQ